MATKLLPPIQEPMTDYNIGKPMSLFDRIAGNPAAAQLALSGLGMLGAKRQSQLNPYLKMGSDAFAMMARKPLNEAQTRNLDAQSKYYEAQALSEGQPPGLWEKGSATLNALNTLSMLAPLDAAGKLTPQQKIDLEIAKAHLSRTTTSYGPGGQPIVQGGMNLDFLAPPQPGTLPEAGAQPAAGPVVATPVAPVEPAVTTPVYPQTPGQVSADKKMADEYIAWTQGGWADTQKSLSQLYSALGNLESGKVQTGDLKAIATSMLPDNFASYLRPDFMDTKEKVEEVAQRNLRLILGAQFAQKEGEKLIARAYNPNIDTALNAERIRRLIKQIGDAATAKQAAMEYYGKHGSLVGYAPGIDSMEELQAKMEAEFLDGIYQGDPSDASVPADDTGGAYYDPETDQFYDTPRY